MGGEKPHLLEWQKELTSGIPEEISSLHIEMTIEWCLLLETSPKRNPLNLAMEGCDRKQSIGLARDITPSMWSSGGRVLESESEETKTDEQLKRGRECRVPKDEEEEDDLQLQAATALPIILSFRSSAACNAESTPPPFFRASFYEILVSTASLPTPLPYLYTWSIPISEYSTAWKFKNTNITLILQELEISILVNLVNKNKNMSLKRNMNKEKIGVK